MSALFFHISPLFSIPSVKSKCTFTNIQGFFRVQQSFPTALSRPPSCWHKTNLKPTALQPSICWVHVCSIRLNVFNNVCFRQRKKCPSLSNNASHTFTWPPLNKPCFQSIKGHISHQILFKLVVPALKNTTSSDYCGSCSYCQWPEHRITISAIWYFHEISPCLCSCVFLNLPEYFL